jgi:hypothetical protein
LKSLKTKHSGVITPVNLYNDGTNIPEKYKTVLNELLAEEGLIKYIINKFKTNPKLSVFECSGNEQISLLPLNIFLNYLSGLNKKAHYIIKNKLPVSSAHLINVLSYLINYQGNIKFVTGNELNSFLSIPEDGEKIIIEQAYSFENVVKDIKNMV